MYGNLIFLPQKGWRKWAKTISINWGTNYVSYEARGIGVLSCRNVSRWEAGGPPLNVTPPQPILAYFSRRKTS